MDRLLLRVNEVAETLALSRTKTYGLIGRGEIPAVAIDGVIRVPVTAVEEFVERLMSAGRDGAAA